MAERDPISAREYAALSERLAERLAWLDAAREKLRRRGAREDDEILRALDVAFDQVYAARMLSHYRSCDRGVYRPQT